MKCYGCSREIKSPKNCSLCENLFCSDSCIEAHQITYHRTNKIFMNNLNYYAPSKNEAKKEISSIFITEGKLYESYHYNPKFKLEIGSHRYTQIEGFISWPNFVMIRFIPNFECRIKEA